MSTATTASLRFQDHRRGMVGRVYRWRGGHWRVITRWSGKGPKNVLLQRVVLEVVPHHFTDIYVDTSLCSTRDGRWWRSTDEFVVRPFGGLRKVTPPA